MRNLMLKILFPIIGIALWLAVCYPICNRPEGFNYFMFWIIAGLPFGIRFMFLKFFPKGYGISGTAGIFIVNVIIGGIIGGAILLTKMVRIIIDTMRISTGKL